MVVYTARKGVRTQGEDWGLVPGKEHRLRGVWGAQTRASSLHEEGWWAQLG